jgi:hypothetical protein
MTNHKCFISFKKENEDRKIEIQNCDKIDMIDKSLNEAINSENPDYVMQKIRDEYLKDSSVTISLIGSYSSEKYNQFIKPKEQYYIKKELQASLYHSKGSGRNGILGVVLPEMYNAVFKGSQTCNVCGGAHNIVKVDDDTVIKEFSVNYYIKEGHTSCAWSEDERYCVLVKWDDFMDDPNKYIDQAWEKRTEPIVDKITVYPK